MRVGWERRDRHYLLTALALLGTAVAALMATYGLPPVNLHGPLHKMGIMDPLCGGTRAARLTAQGRWAEAWKYNPLGIVAVVGAAAVTVRAAGGLLLGRWLTVQPVWTPRRRKWAVVLVASLVIALEVRQQLRADLLIAGT